MEKEAEALRQKGNAAYGEGRLVEAELLYGESIAVKDTAAARANRATVRPKTRHGADVEDALEVRRLRREEQRRGFLLFMCSASKNSKNN